LRFASSKPRSASQGLIPHAVLANIKYNAPSETICDEAGFRRWRIISRKSEGHYLRNHA
jgi:hypothetical protein